MKSCVLMAAAAFVVAAVGDAKSSMELELAMNGEVRVGSDGARLGAVIYKEGWSGSLESVVAGGSVPRVEDGTAPIEMFDGNRVAVRGFSSLQSLADGRALLNVALKSELDMNPEGVVLALTMPCSKYAGATWNASSGAHGVFPKSYAGQMIVYIGDVNWIEVAPEAGHSFKFAFPAATRIVIQDDRKWGQTLTLRISPNLQTCREFRAGDERAFCCRISSPDGTSVKCAHLTVVKSGAEWIPLDYRKNIIAGSALDFSNQGLQDAPAGKYGWLKSVNGHFEFEKRPGVKQRFYGVNLCFSACFPDEKTADELAERLTRLGYNAVRFHHYEYDDGVIRGAPDRLTINEDRIRRLDYLLAKLYERGIYATTDLYTIRPVMWRDIGIDRDGQVPGQVYKNLIGIYEPAYANWQTFAKNLLTHVNPYTGRRYMDEPALPLVSLINEGNLIWCWNDMKSLPMMRDAWRDWLREKRGKDASFAPGVSDDPAQQVPWDNATVTTFMADVERKLSKRQRAFLRSIGVKALLTSQNCGNHYTQLMVMREDCYDYVDDHFYVDHPQFLGRDWQLPSKCGNANPVLSQSLAPVTAAFTRMPDKPFTITEWNFSGPGMFRGVGGLMTGALGALQGWDGLWRFAYSHDDHELKDRTGVPGYFNVASDPLGQASDRASICLFLRGDLGQLEPEIVQMVTSDAFRSKGSPVGIVPCWQDAVWNTRVATGVAPVASGVVTCGLAENLNKANPPVATVANRAVKVDRARGAFLLDTPRTAGGFAPSGAFSCGAIDVDVGDTAATVWASSLDGKPIAKSSRILVTHLTDVQADGNVYADDAKTILLKWGAYPPVVRAGKAKVSLLLDEPGKYRVWGLDTAGKRVSEVAHDVVEGKLVFTANIASEAGARLSYELARE